LRADGPIEERLPGFDEFLKPATEQLHLAWDEAETRERRARTIFAQETIRPEEVADELTALRAAVGSGADVATFVGDAVTAYGGLVRGKDPFTIDVKEAPQALRDAIGIANAHPVLTARFDLPVAPGVTYLSRTHPVVAGLAAHVLDEALDSTLHGKAARCGAIRTKSVERRTTLLLCRFRLHLIAESRDEQVPLLAEDAGLLAFAGQPDAPTWLDPAEAEALLAARPSDNVDASVARDWLAGVLDAESNWRPHIEDEADRRASALVDAHARVRDADARRGSGRRVRYRATAQRPVDVLGIYFYLPAVV
jgi:hypothetical protein